MNYNRLVKEYYNNLDNLTHLLKTLVDSYRLLVASAAELNTINEARTSAVKDAVHRANELGDTIDHLIDLVDECGESYFKYCQVVGDYILKKSDSKIILTEVDEELFFKDSNLTRNDNEKMETYKDTKIKDN